MVNIQFTKIWEDEYFFEIEVKAYSKKVSLTMNTYINDEIIDVLSDKIRRFVNKEINDFFWETSISGNDTTANFAMKVFYKDNIGHLRIEIYGEIDDGASFEEHNCCFYIDGIELGQLESFGRRIQHLKNQGVGKKISVL